MQPASAGIQGCASVTVALMISYGERVPKEREGRKEGRKEKSVVVVLFSTTVLKGPGQVPPCSWALMSSLPCSPGRGW